MSVPPSAAQRWSHRQAWVAQRGCHRAGHPPRRPPPRRSPRPIRQQPKAARKVSASGRPAAAGLRSRRPVWRSAALRRSPSEGVSVRRGMRAGPGSQAPGSDRKPPDSPQARANRSKPPRPGSAVGEPTPASQRNHRPHRPRSTDQDPQPPEPAEPTTSPTAPAPPTTPPTPPTAPPPHQHHQDAAPDPCPTTAKPDSTTDHQNHPDDPATTKPAHARPQPAPTP